jgi:Fic family protein
MKPPFQITSPILNLVSSISEKIGKVKAIHLDKPSPELRRINRIKTIKASLEIEGNVLDEAQITAILEEKRVLGPEKDILEVRNAIEVYSRLGQFAPNSLSSFLSAHKILMNGLMDAPGALRMGSVGILKGSQVSHVAPPADKLHILLEDLFSYLKDSEDHVLIKSSVVHYEIEFIHPFIDGNGRMGRLWQTLILCQEYPLFEFLPFETIISHRQKKYYEVLERSDKLGHSTLFIEFMLTSINDALDDLLSHQSPNLTVDQRLSSFISSYPKDVFTRKDYMSEYRELSPATASRDMRRAVEMDMVEKMGDKRNTSYRILRR